MISSGGVDLLARCMQQLYGEKLIAHGPRNLGASPRPVWDGAEIQQLHNWRVTAAGRQDAELFRERVKAALDEVSHVPSGRGRNEETSEGHEHSHDVFISHASEDKEGVARPLADALTERGWRTWLDELQLTVGDSLSGRIDEALSRSRFGVVILSPSFFAKQWPKRELSGLAAREVQSGTKVILPVWHEVDQRAIVEFSPTLADRLGVSTSKGVDHVAEQLARALEVAYGRPPAADATERMVQAVPVSDSTSSVDQSAQEMSSKTAAMIALARVLLDKGDVLAAETYLRQAVDAGDSHAMALLGMALGERGRREESADLLQQAVEAGQREALAPLGLVLHELGRLDEAEQVLRRAAAG